MTEFTDNLARAKDYLARFKTTTTGHFINGQMLVPEGASTYTNTSPVDNCSIGEVVQRSSADIDKAFAAAGRQKSGDCI